MSRAVPARENGPASPAATRAGHPARRRSRSRVGMRRRASLVLLALAVFCTALSPLLRWYAFPRLVKIPANQYQDMVLEAKDATLLDYGTMKPETVSKVTIVQTLKGNVEASEKIERTAGRDVVVWEGLSYVVGPDGKMVSE